MTRGRRGLKKETLAQLLNRLGLQENRLEKPVLILDQILKWADEFREENGEWPKSNSGKIKGTKETWSAINQSLIKGNRGLLGGSSLAKLLEENRNVSNKSNLRQFSETEVRQWIDEFTEIEKEFPTKTSGRIKGEVDLEWNDIDRFFNQGVRGLPKIGSLANFIYLKFGKAHNKSKSKLTTQQILKWADEFREENGEWPKRDSGKIKGTDETWSAIDSALSSGGRGFDGDSSLAQILNEKRSLRNVGKLAKLTPEKIIFWIEEYFKLHNKYPKRDSGKIPESPDEDTWINVDGAMKKNLRGLEMNTTLKKFIKEHFKDKPEPKKLTNLQKKIVQLKSKGKLNSEIAKEIKRHPSFISQTLKREHVKNLLI
jgi:hypothetical protein